MILRHRLVVFMIVILIMKVVAQCSVQLDEASCVVAVADCGGKESTCVWIDEAEDTDQTSYDIVFCFFLI